MVIQDDGWVVWCTFRGGYIQTNQSSLKGEVVGGTFNVCGLGWVSCIRLNDGDGLGTLRIGDISSGMI